MRLASRGWKQWFHAFIRAIVLILLGVFLSSMGTQQTHWEFPNVLAQIGLGYVFVFRSRSLEMVGSGRCDRRDPDRHVDRVFHAHACRPTTTLLPSALGGEGRSLRSEVPAVVQERQLGARRGCEVPEQAAASGGQGRESDPVHISTAAVTRR